MVLNPSLEATRVSNSIRLINFLIFLVSNWKGVSTCQSLTYYRKLCKSYKGLKFYWLSTQKQHGSLMLRLWTLVFQNHYVPCTVQDFWVVGIGWSVRVTYLQWGLGDCCVYVNSSIVDEGGSRQNKSPTCWGPIHSHSPISLLASQTLKPTSSHSTWITWDQLMVFDAIFRVKSSWNHHSLRFQLPNKHIYIDVTYPSQKVHKIPSEMASKTPN